MIEKRISLEAWQHNGKMPPPMLLVQGESLGRRVYMRLLSGGVPIDLSGATVTFYFKKPSGLEEYLPAAIENEAEGEILVEMTSQSCAEAGEIRNAEVRISFADGKNARILGPRLMIEEGMNDDAILSSNEYLALDEALQEVEGLMGSVMKKEVYDTNNNGIVDNSEKLGGETAAWYQDKITALEGSMADTEEKVSTLSNPNLLINGEFAVWQRGESFTIPRTGYGTGKYTADRWRVWANADSTGGNITVTKADDGMHIEADGAGFATYRFEEAEVKKLSGKTVTLSQSVDGVVSSAVRSFPTTGILNVTLPASGTINWIKLELGEEATPYVPKGYGEELLACMRYYQVTGAAFCAGYLTAQTASCTYTLPVPMRTTPTIAGGVNQVTVRPIGADPIYDQTATLLSSSSSGSAIYLQVPAPGAATQNQPCTVQFSGITLNAEMG